MDAMNGIENGNGKRRPIRAGKAFMAAIENDPEAQRAVGDVAAKFRMYAQSVKALAPTPGDALAALRSMLAETKTPSLDELAALRGEQQRAFAEVAAEWQQAVAAKNAELAAYGFDPPGEDLEEWEDLARLVEKDAGPMTIADIYQWAIAWAER